jgi:hypothetical protein
MACSSIKMTVCRKVFLLWGWGLTRWRLKRAKPQVEEVLLGHWRVELKYVRNDALVCDVSPSKLLLIRISYNLSASRYRHHHHSHGVGLDHCAQILQRGTHRRKSGLIVWIGTPNKMILNTLTALGRSHWAWLVLSPGRSLSPLLSLQSSSYNLCR